MNVEKVSCLGLLANWVFTSGFVQKGCRNRVIEQLLKKYCHCSCVLLLIIRPSESRTVPFYLETSLSFRCFGNLKRLLFIFLKESHCHAEAQLNNTILMHVCSSAYFMARSWGGKWGPFIDTETPTVQNCALVCFFSVLLPALKALFSTDFSFKIYVGERTAAEGSAHILHLVCPTAVGAQAVKRQRTG